MSLAISSALARFKPTLKTLFTVGTYMGCGDLLTQKIALKREKLEARRAFAFFTAGFTFSGLGNHLANTAAGKLFPTTRFNDVLRRTLVLNLLFPITQSITFLSVMFWRDGTIRKNWKTKVVKDLPQAYMISLFCLTPLSFLQGRYVAGNYRKWTAWIQGTYWNMWLSGLNLPNREYRTFDDYFRSGMAQLSGSYAYFFLSDKKKKKSRKEKGSKKSDKEEE